MADGKPPSNLGCVLALIAFPFVVLIGIIIGLVLRDNDEGPTEAHDTLESGELDGTSWQVDAVLDVDGQTCIFLYEDGADDPLNGTCDLQPQDVTYGDQTVLFGRAASDADQVTVEVQRAGFVDPEPVILETTTADGMDGRFYVAVVPGDLDAISATSG
jgi:hypothetical protein